ncbi:hypothetical protein FRC12_017305, partial [Ceratobasidium sp. 428]
MPRTLAGNAVSRRTDKFQRIPPDTHSIPSVCACDPRTSAAGADGSIYGTVEQRSTCSLPPPSP